MLPCIDYSPAFPPFTLISNSSVAPAPRLLLPLRPFPSPPLSCSSGTVAFASAQAGGSLGRVHRKHFPRCSLQKPPTVTAFPAYTPPSSDEEHGIVFSTNVRVKVELRRKKVLTHVSVILFNAAPSVLLYQSFHKTPRMLPVADIRRDPADTHTMAPSGSVCIWSIIIRA